MHLHGVQQLQRVPADNWVGVTVLHDTGVGPCVSKAGAERVLSTQATRWKQTYHGHDTSGMVLDDACHERRLVVDVSRDAILYGSAEVSQAPTHGGHAWNSDVLLPW